MNISQYIVFIIILIGLSYIYKKLKLDESTNTPSHYHKMVDKYLINKNALGMINKPLLWIHIHNDNTIIPEVNSRFWISFYSRDTTEFNQPYQYLTIKSIINKCGNDFNIYIIDDKSFNKIIPNWCINLSTVAIPIRAHIRLLALSMILNIYGGILVPSSFICFKSLKDLYNNNISKNKMFVGEFANRTASQTLADKTVIPSPILMGCEAKNNEMEEFVKYLEIANSKDFTAEVDFLGKINNWLNTKVNKSKINAINGQYLGTQDTCGSPIAVEELVGSSFIKLNDEALGLYVPWNDLINRTSLQWFVRLSPQQVLESNTVIGKYLLVNN